MPVFAVVYALFRAKTKPFAASQAAFLAWLRADFFSDL